MSTIDDIRKARALVERATRPPPNPPEYIVEEDENGVVHIMTLFLEPVAFMHRSVYDQIRAELGRVSTSPTHNPDKHGT